MAAVPAFVNDWSSATIERVRGLPAFTLPAIAVALCGLYLVSLRESHFSEQVQLSAGWACVGLLFVIRYLPRSRQAPLRFIFILVAGFLAMRYFWWRTFETLIYTHPLDFTGMALLYIAELYSVTILLLSLFVNLWPLERAPVAPPADPALWPTVDVFIPTFNEDVEIVRVTALAATQIDYPRDKLKVYILDDGGTLAKRRNPAQAPGAWRRRYQLIALARELGIEYVTRETNRHAKAGNLNHALGLSQGEVVLFLDCDHIPTQDILRNTVGHFTADPKLFLVQTPHFFSNAAPAERSMGSGRPMPDESEMFYRVIHPGLDAWNSSYFCGSAALMRRTCLEEIGGICVGSITEDAETALQLHRRGYNSVYVNRPMVCGLSANSYADYVVQHSRWAQGMVQIFLLHNPLFGRGLTLAQRMCYFNCFIFWFFGLARLVYFMAPMAFLVFGMAIYHASAQQVLAYSAPYVLSTFVIADFLFGNTRKAFFSEIYESIQSAFLAPAVIETLRHPHRPTFKVTPKSTQSRDDRLSTLSFAFFFVFCVNLAAVIAGGWRFVTMPEYRDVVAVTLFWGLYNVYLAVVSVGALWERRQVRGSHRLRVAGPIHVEFPRLRQGFDAELFDLALSGVAFVGRFPFEVVHREHIEILAEGPGGRMYRFEAIVHRVVHRKDGKRTGDILCGARIVHPEAQFADLVSFVYGDSRRWLQVLRAREKAMPIMVALWNLVRMGLKGSVLCLVMATKTAYAFARGLLFPAKVAVELTRKVAPEVLRTLKQHSRTRPTSNRKTLPA